MKPYPVIPACGGACQQGKRPCTTEALCTTHLHRVPSIPDAEVTDEDKPSALLVILVAGVALACAGVAALPFLIGAI